MASTPAQTNGQLNQRPFPAKPAYEILPAGIVRTRLSSCIQTLSPLGLELDEWQQQIVRGILAERADGTYAASRVVISIPRQAGKTFLVGALCVYDAIKNPGTTTVWTAHRFKVARESFDFMQSICSTPAMARHVDKDRIHAAHGNEAIHFRNGSRIVFAARERGSIRGFAKVRRIIFDEAQILSNQALSDLLPTMNQAWNPQRVMMGTPPKPSDPGEAFTRARTTALEGKSSRTYYVEYSAPDGSSIDDTEAWFRGNPSLGDRTPLERVTDLREELPDEDDFAREAMGMWDKAGDQAVLDQITWDRAQRADDDHTQPVHEIALAVAVAGDLSSASVGFAGRREDGKYHIEILDQRAGYMWVPAYVKELLNSNTKIRAVVLDLGSGSRALTDDFERLKIRYTAPKVLDVGESFVRFIDGISSGNIVHIGQVQLALARSGTRKRPLGDTGMNTWSRKNSTSDITPFEAVTLALWGSINLTVNKPTRRSGRRVLVLQ